MSARGWNESLTHPVSRAGARRRLALPIALSLLILPVAVHGQSGASALAQAEESYAEIDFDGALSRAQGALEAGGLTRSQLARAYELIGISAMALEQRDRSRIAFVRMLALTPDARLDRSLSPTLRESFLEARGFWATQTERLGLTVDFVRERGALRLRLSDPIDIVELVVIRSRTEGTTEYQESREAAAATIFVPVDGAIERPRVEYSLAALDQYGNRLVEVGDDDVPEVIGREVEPIDASADVAPRGPRSRVWLWVVIGVLAAGAVGGGIATGVVLGQQAQTVSLASDVAWIR